jgi:hypothetical protein
MAKFESMLLNKGEYSEGFILQPTTLELCWAPQYFSHTAFKECMAIGLTFQLYKINEIDIIEHNGATSGFTSCMTLIPSFDLGVLVFSNLDEIFRIDRTLSIKNEIIRFILDFQSPLVGQIPSNLAVIQKLKGVYGPYPGILTNTRVIQDGAEFYIKIKHESLMISGLLNGFKGVKLYPTLNPAVYERIPRLKTNILFTTLVGFEFDSNGNVKHLCYGFNRLRKLAWYQSIRFKTILGFILLLSIIIVLGILL